MPCTPLRTIRRKARAWSISSTVTTRRRPVTSVMSHAAPVTTLSIFGIDLTSSVWTSTKTLLRIAGNRHPDIEYVKGETTNFDLARAWS